MFEWTTWWGTLAAVVIAFVIVALIAVFLMVINATVGKQAPLLRALIADASAWEEVSFKDPSLAPISYAHPAQAT